MAKNKHKRRIVYPLDYDPITLYWNDITAGKEIVGEKIKAVYKELTRIINDPDSEWEYNHAKGNHALEFIENYCKHSKGKFGGKPFIMELWQKAIIAATFGIVHKIDGTRKYQEVILVVARKNGKSTLAAAVGLYMMVADGEPGAEIYAVATKKDQAKIIWLEAKRMVRKSTTLLKRIKTLVSELYAEFADAYFRPLGSDSDGLDGLNVHCALMDEIHAWKDKNLYDVIVDGTSARDQPLIFITTTAGTIRECVYDMKYDECVQIINGYAGGEYRDERVLPIIYELDDRKEWKVSSCWKKANPGLGTIKKTDNLAGKVRKALANALLVKNLLCKDFNIRETGTQAWLNFDDLNNETRFSIKELKPKYGIGGGDLSQTTDLTCATILFQVPDDDHIYVLQMYFLPEELLDDRVQEDHIRYDLWRDAGLLRTTPGMKVDTEFVTQWFLEMQEEYDIYIPWTGYDAWSADYWVKDMKNNFGEESMEKIQQTKKVLSNPMQNLAADLKKKRIVYNNNPILKWCLANTTVDIDKYDNIQPKKTRNQRLRIDGTASLLDAYVAFENHKEEYQSMI